MRSLCLSLVLCVLGCAGSVQAATRYQCLVACIPNQLNLDCGWITRPGKFNRCRARLIRQCRKWGTDTMCPASQQPPPPVTTTTTLPPVSLIGSYQFQGTIDNDPCGVPGVGSSLTFHFSVTGQSGYNLSGTMGVANYVSSGTLDAGTGVWNFRTTQYVEGEGCTADSGLNVNADYGFTSGVGATWYAESECPSLGAYCRVDAYGTVY